MSFVPAVLLTSPTASTRVLLMFNPDHYKLYDLTRPSTIGNVPALPGKTAIESLEAAGSLSGFLREGNTYFLAPMRADGSTGANIESVSSSKGPLTFKMERPEPAIKPVPVRL